MEPLKFDISLVVLHHLGRNLYRNFSTILGEAISNSWDAEAENVRINYEPKDRRMLIVDDGLGMDRNDLQEKFLKIGYSKRNSLGSKSPNKKRNYIGRKGIGKLALLSCADRVVVLSKKAGEERQGVIIDNGEIDREIDNDTGVAKYKLQEPEPEDYTELFNAEQGTAVIFEGLKEEKNRSEKFLNKVVALYFRFSIFDPKFKIFLNEKEVTIKALSGLADDTQFVWNINQYNSDPYLKMVTPALDIVMLKSKKEQLRGFIASVKKPTNRNIFGAKERIGVDLFVNGRMRELDILKHSPSSRIPEEYLYGQIHIDSLDDGGLDRFTSSREGVQADDVLYGEYLDEIRALVLKIIDQWDDLREKCDDDGDVDNPKRGGAKIKKAKSLFREVAKKYVGRVKDKELVYDAAFNASSYVECFISENALRKYIIENGSVPTTCSNESLDGETCEDRGYKPLCEYCKSEAGKRNFQKQKYDAATSISIRSDEENNLLYLDYIDLAKIIDDKVLRKEDQIYKPLRNSVMHTSRLTEEAQTRLTAVFDNIVATVRSIGIDKRK